MSTRLQKASDALAAQLMVWHKLYRYHVEVNDGGEFMDTRDMWSQADQSAMDEYNDAKADALGQRSLPFEDAS